MHTISQEEREARRRRMIGNKLRLGRRHTAETRAKIWEGELKYPDSVREKIVAFRSGALVEENG